MSVVTHYILDDFPCAILKGDGHPFTHLCGYVGVPPSHPWYGKDDSDMRNVEVHGGISWQAHEQGGHPTQIAFLQRKADAFDERPSTGLSNFYRRWLEEAKEAKPGPGYPCDTGQDVWWIGFDCNHLWDQSNPKDERYVRQEIEGLVSQAAEAMRQPDPAP